MKKRKHHVRLFTDSTSHSRQRWNARVVQAVLGFDLTVRYLKPVVELGEPVFIELRFRKVSDEKVNAHDLLDPGAGLVQFAITNSQGERRPCIPLVQPRSQPRTIWRQRGSGRGPLLSSYYK